MFSAERVKLYSAGDDDARRAFDLRIFPGLDDTLHAVGEGCGADCVRRAALGGISTVQRDCRRGRRKVICEFGVRSR